jgi:hypothetical protein
MISVSVKGSVNRTSLSWSADEAAEIHQLGSIPLAPHTAGPSGRKALHSVNHANLNARFSAIPEIAPDAMNTINIDLTKLHGFRLLAATSAGEVSAFSAESLPQVLGARLGEPKACHKVQPAPSSGASR